ncbi:MAG: PIG-L family deacetylase [Deltaproteobacteria bacterium]|nr:PIG-L family deacetylase [Deltaproteobacteria bacterium]
MKQLFRLARQFFLRRLIQQTTVDLHFDDDVMIIAPHPDDEVLGCGGLIAQASRKGVNVEVIILTGGGASHDNCCGISQEEVKRERRNLTKEALKTLGLNSNKITFLDWEDGKLPLSDHPDFDTRVDELAALLARLKPANIFCPHPFEGWSDHVAAQEITREAIKRSNVKTTFYYYCVWFWLSMPLRKSLMCDWKNAVALDISDVYVQKQKAIKEYMGPCAPCGNPWSGVLPEELMKAFEWEKELFFRVI